MTNMVRLEYGARGSGSGLHAWHIPPSRCPSGLDSSTIFSTIRYLAPLIVCLVLFGVEGQFSVTPRRVSHLEMLKERDVRL